MKHGIKLIAFDMDGTLTEGYSWTLFHAVGGVTLDEQNEWRTKYFSQDLTYDAWLKKIETKYRKSRKTKADFVSVTQSIPFKKGTQEVVRLLQKQYPVHIVSASVDIYVETVARILGITEFHANHTFVFDKEDRLEKIAYRLSETEAKVNYLQKVCKKHGLKPQEICFVGDSLGDMGAFEYTNSGILIGDGVPKLQKVSWKRIQTLSELTTLFLKV